MFVTQFALALFGVSLAISVSALDGEEYGWLVYAVSAFSVLFYLVLIYSDPWKFGSQDRLSFDYGKKKRNLWTGFFIGLVASIPNFLLAIITMICVFFGADGAAELFRIIGLYLQGTYIGLLQFKIGDVALNAHWWIMFVITIPSIVTCTLGYIAGFFNFRVFRFPEKRSY